jgi:hypothetical protein
MVTTTISAASVSSAGSFQNTSSMVCWRWQRGHTVPARMPFLIHETFSLRQQFLRVSAMTGFGTRTHGGMDCRLDSTGSRRPACWLFPWTQGRSSEFQFGQGSTHFGTRTTNCPVREGPNHGARRHAGQRSTVEWELIVIARTSRMSITWASCLTNRSRPSWKKARTSAVGASLYGPSQRSSSEPRGSSKFAARSSATRSVPRSWPWVMGDTCCRSKPRPGRRLAKEVGRMVKVHF